MGRLAWAQLRFRTARLVALPLGMLLAATALTVLATSRISQLRTIGWRESVLARLVVTEAW